MRRKDTQSKLTGYWAVLPPLLPLRPMPLLVTTKQEKGLMLKWKQTR